MLCCAGRYERLQQQLEQCYPDVELTPSPEELRQVVQAAGPG